jgi:hypothetical protein
MGSPGIGKSVFGLYLVARLICSSLEIFSQPILLMSWQPPWGERRWIRVHFSGKVEAIGRKEFDSDANDGTFAIFDGLAFNKECPLPGYLSIVSPAECVPLPAVSMMLYAPPIKRENLDLLTDVSKGYQVRDDTAYRDTHGSLETRMKIVGGNLRLLFSDLPVEYLKGKFTEAIRKVKFTQIPELYFSGGESDRDGYHHFVFAAFPESPFDKPGEIDFVSDFAKDMLMKARDELTKEKQEELNRLRRRWCGV